MTSNLWRRVARAEREVVQRHTTTLPVAIGPMLQELGVGILGATLPGGISGQIQPSNRFPSGFLIRVNRHEARVRQRFTAAHELAHFLLHRDLIGEGLTDDVLYRSGLSDRKESEANRLAADILMPTTLLQSEMKKLTTPTEDSVQVLAKKFQVSADAMRIAIENL